MMITLSPPPALLVALPASAHKAADHDKRHQCAPPFPRPLLPVAVLQSWHGHQSRVLSLVFHPDGKQIASGGFDGVVNDWDVASGACLETVHAKGPYAGMNISGVTGISEAQKAALRALGAVEE